MISKGLITEREREREADNHTHTGKTAADGRRAHTDPNQQNISPYFITQDCNAKAAGTSKPLKPHRSSAIFPEWPPSKVEAAGGTLINHTNACNKESSSSSSFALLALVLAPLRHFRVRPWLPKMRSHIENRSPLPEFREYGRPPTWKLLKHALAVLHHLLANKKLARPQRPCSLGILENV